MFCAQQPSIRAPSCSCLALRAGTLFCGPLQPLEALGPLINNPGLAGGGRPLWIEALIKLKPLLMSLYFGADHIVWVQQVGGAAMATLRSRTVVDGAGPALGGATPPLSRRRSSVSGLVVRRRSAPRVRLVLRPPASPRLPQAGLMDNKGLTNRAQKASLYGWFGGSLCTIVLELYELAGGPLSLRRFFPLFSTFCAFGIARFLGLCVLPVAVCVCWPVLGGLALRVRPQHGTA